jgi:hypothetical protein
MNPSNQSLAFVDASASTFINALQVQSATQPILMIGAGLLADEIRTLARKAGIQLHISAQMPATAILQQYRVLAFTEQDGEHLGQLLLQCLDLNNIHIIAPVTQHHFSQMPLFIVSIPKAGTHLVYELATAMGYATGVELPDFPKPKTWYCIEYSNSHTVARDFFVDTVRRSPFGNRHHPFGRSPTLFIYRHPLDILVSEAQYYHLEGKTSFAGYFDGLDFEGRVNRLMDDEWLLGSLRQRVGGFLPWLSFPNVVPASFEELVGDAGGGSTQAQHRLIWSIILKLQVDGSVAEIANKVFNKNSATFREGKIGAWRTQLKPALIEKITPLCQDIISTFGYSSSTQDSLLPTRAIEHAARPLRFATGKSDRTPILVIPNYMSCSIVSYAHRFYAIPGTAGAVAVDQLSADQLDRLPSSESLSELKEILLIGRKAYDRQRAELNHAGLSLLTNKESPVYWKENNTPALFFEYKGYNLHVWQGRFFALRQTLGPVDLVNGLNEAMTRSSYGDILISHDVDDLISHVDLSLRLDEHKAQLHVQMHATLQHLTQAIEKLEQERADQDQRIAGLLQRLESLAQR